MFDQLLDKFSGLLSSLGTTLPLPVFVIVGSILEELISPIPATLVLGVAGSAVALGSLGVPFLLLLTVLATVGKSGAAWLTYWLGRSLGEFVIERWGKYFGINVKDVHDVNLKLRTKNAWWLLFALRSLPIAPSAAVSIASGIVRMRQRVFGSATFAGYLIRNLLIAFVGYGGPDFLKNWEKYATDPWYGIVAAILLTLLAIYFFIKGYQKYYAPPAKKPSDTSEPQ